MNAETGNQNKQSLNVWIYLLLGFAIFSNIGKLFLHFAILQMCNNEIFQMYYDRNVVIFSIIASIALITFLLGTIFKQKWGVIGVFCIQFVNLIGIQVLSKSQQVGSSDFLVTCIICVLFALLLMLRSNGRSGWDVIFEDSESDDEIEDYSLEELPTSQKTVSEEDPSKKETNSEGLESSMEESCEEPK